MVCVRVCSQVKKRTRNESRHTNTKKTISDFIFDFSSVSRLCRARVWCSSRAYVNETLLFQQVKRRTRHLAANGSLHEKKQYNCVVHIHTIKFVFFSFSHLALNLILWAIVFLSFFRARVRASNWLAQEAKLQSIISGRARALAPSASLLAGALINKLVGCKRMKKNARRSFQIARTSTQTEHKVCESSRYFCVDLCANALAYCNLLCARSLARSHTKWLRKRIDYNETNQKEIEILNF